MPRKPDELQAGALNAWTPIQQAALYQNYLARQAELDDKANLQEYAAAEEKKKRGVVRPESVKAGKIVDDLMKKHCPALYNFLDTFGPPHIAIIAYIAIHTAFWCFMPWYLHQLLTFPTLKIIPIFNTLKSIYSKKDRAAWQAWWLELCLVEYLELVFFKDTSRSLIWWPKIKAFVFVILYSVVDHEVIQDLHTGQKLKKPIYGAIKIITPWLPEVEKDSRDDKDKDKNKDKDKGKEKDKEKEKDKGKEKDKEKEKNKDKKKT